MVCGISFGYEDRAHPANTYRMVSVSGTAVKMGSTWF
jgi:hypothetical protein